VTQDLLTTNDSIFMRLQFTAHGQAFHTLLVFTYCDDILYPITLVCGLEIQR
jgi:hypothetical protein